MMGWANELVQQKQVDRLHLSFLIAGHTKFSPDLLYEGELVLHDFVYAKSASGVIATVRNLCYTGPYEQSTIHVLRGRMASECIIPDSVTHSYAAPTSKTSKRELFLIFT